MRATWSVRLALFDLMILIIFGEKYMFNIHGRTEKERKKKLEPLTRPKPRYTCLKLNFRVTSPQCFSREVNCWHSSCGHERNMAPPTSAKW
jgi:hypothetical protein